MISYFHITRGNQQQQTGIVVLSPCTITYQKPFSSRQNNRNNSLQPEQEPASGSKRWAGEANQSALFTHADEWMVSIEKTGSAGPAEQLTVQGRLIQEEKRTGRGNIQPR
jgi:hypothetical protein